MQLNGDDLKKRLKETCKSFDLPLAVSSISRSYFVLARKPVGKGEVSFVKMFVFFRNFLRKTSKKYLYSQLSRAFRFLSNRASKL